MLHFDFKGEIPASKSVLNRALVIQSYSNSVKIKGDSHCDDVKFMKLALAQLMRGLEDQQAKAGSSFDQPIAIHCGEAGTVLRFMAFRVSRETGIFKLVGSERLLARPHLEMKKMLEPLGVAVQFESKAIIIKSHGWQRPEQNIQLSRETSSQFASALLLNCWELPFDLNLEIVPGLSESYFQLTVDLLKQAGLKIQSNGNSWIVKSSQKPLAGEIYCELDVSSAFPLALAGVLAGSCEIRNWSLGSQQPDKVFLEILRAMGARIEIKPLEPVGADRFQDLSRMISKKSSLKGLNWDIAQSPDLFPVLSVACCFAEGRSKLVGAPHLKSKESDRIHKTHELLTLAGFKSFPRSDGIEIEGVGDFPLKKSFSFDPDHDHRMAMAAGLLKLKGFDIHIRNSEVVSKSLPEFWDMLSISPEGANL